MSDDRKAAMLGKVRALLAKAEGTEFEGEAQVFRAKADELMTQYAILEWELKGDDKDNRTPIKRMYDMTWYHGEFKEKFWVLFQIVAQHCRVQVANLYFTGHSIPLVGMEADMDYMDMLFTNLMIELMKRINPTPSEALTFEENLVMLKEAGLGWQEIAVLFYENLPAQFPARAREQLPHPDADNNLPGDAQKNKENKRAIRSSVKLYGPPFAHVYRDYCKRTGHPQAYTNYMTYRKNFADGFSDVIRDRLREMRREQKVEEKDDNPMALAIRDIRQTVKDSFFDMFPHQADKRMQRYARQTGKIDYAARGQGAKAGQEARIRVNPQKDIGQRRELRRG